MAAAEKLHLHLIHGRTLDDCRVYSRAALEAAERVRAEALPAKQDDAERARRYRARKRDGRDAVPVTAVTESVTGVTQGTFPGRLAEIINTDDLLVKLLDAADGNVQSGVNDTAPIRVLLAAGCDLDLDDVTRGNTYGDPGRDRGGGGKASSAPYWWPHAG